MIFLIRMKIYIHYLLVEEDIYKKCLFPVLLLIGIGFMLAIPNHFIIQII